MAGGNKKQIPKIKEILAEKEYNDLVYGYLQTICNEHGKIEKKKFKATTFARALGMSRQTMSKKLQYLFDMEFLVDEGGNYIQVNELPENVVSMIPLPTLEILVNTLSEKAISVYVYLFNRYYAVGCKTFSVNYAQIKAWVGLSTETRSNDKVVRDILEVLDRLKLIERRVVTKNIEGTIRSVTLISKVNLYVPDYEG